MMRFLLALVLVSRVCWAQQLAFPTAEGFGRFAQGGRGGKAYLINSLSNATGTGGSCNAGGCSGGTITFKDCFLDRFAVGARTCIFRVGGLIDWPCQSCFTSVPDFITIAGQTAPGDGIMFKGFQLEFLDTRHAIVRHVRVRPGVTEPVPDSAGAVEVYGNTRQAQNIIFDHVSLGWAYDDAISVTNGADITYQWCLMTEGLGIPASSQPSKVGLTGGPGSSRVSMLHNYMAHHWYRAPSHGTGDGQVVNNLLYNIGDFGITLFPHPNYGTVGGDMEVVNNYLRPGPNSNPDYPKIKPMGAGDQGVTEGNALASSMYVLGNVHTTLRPNAATGTELDPVERTGNPLIPIVGSPLGFPTVPSQTSAVQAVTDVLAKAGAYAVAGGTATVRRDSVDQRAIDDWTNGTGRMDIVNESNVGGYPTYNTGTPYTDTDNDGISDSWETAHSLNPNDAADGPTLAVNGYSNLENFINELAGDPAIPFTSAVAARLGNTRLANVRLGAVEAPTCPGDYCQDFEGTGIPAGGWSASAGTVDWDNTTAPLAGLQDMLLDSTEIATYDPNFNASTIYMAAHISTTNALEGDEGVQSIFRVRTGTTALGTLSLDTAGSQWRCAVNGGGSNDGGSLTGLESGVKIKVRYVVGTGTNSSCTAWVWTGSAWSQVCTIGNGTNTSTVDHAQYLATTSEEGLKVDSVVFSATDILSPE